MRDGGLSKDEHRTNEKPNLLVVVFLFNRPEPPIHALPRICVLRLPRLGFANSLEESVCNVLDRKHRKRIFKLFEQPGDTSNEVVAMSTFYLLNLCAFLTNIRHRLCVGQSRPVFGKGNCGLERIAGLAKIKLLIRVRHR